MKIAFLEPPPEKEELPVDRIYGCNYRNYPLPNIYSLSMATVLNESNYSARILDLSIRGRNMENLIKTVKKDFFDAYVMFTPFLAEKHDIEVGKKIRKYDEEAFIIYTGPAPTQEAESFLFDCNVLVVRGEPEITLRELIEALENEKRLRTVDGITYLQEGEIKENETRGIINDLDELPFPDRSLLENNDFYKDPRTGGRATVILTSRGCNYNCYYCVGNAITLTRKIEYRRYNNGKNPPPTIRSVKNVIREFKDIAERGYEAVDVADNRINWSKNRTRKIAEEVSELDLDLFVRERPDSLDKESVRMLKKAGMKHFALGAESFNQETLDFTRKNMEVDEIHRAVELLKEHGVEVELNMMIGADPNESKEDIEKSLKKAKNLNPDYLLLNVCTPYPGTDFCEMCQEHDWIVGDVRDISPRWESIISYPHVSKEELEEIIRRNWEFYFSPKYIVEQIKKGSPKEWIEKGKAALNLVKMYFKTG